MSKVNPRLASRLKRQARVRKKVQGTAERPRLCVFRSTAHIYAQIIDDEKGATIAAVSTLSPALKEALKGLKKAEAAKAVGKAVAEAAKEKGCGKVVFDRNGFLYHGRIKALSEGAREGGLDF
ncbi:50S ribosomal protein L18 [Deltaproteobacteria bacterium OttesenSCG-928-K17]|nr:50S ribosomal protein L18 [Deltaproteobacteria bacterium OttesenSCG-928-K17]